ncbi:MAG: acyl-CoA dehydrogenase family protein [Thermoplasmata archaeon]
MREETDIILRTVEEFSKKYIEPEAKRIDFEDHIPDDLWDKFYDYGLMLLRADERYGGINSDMKTFLEILKIISFYSGGIGLSLEAHNGLGLDHVLKFGNEEQKSEVIEKIKRYHRPVAWALTETSSGSDAKNMKTEYRKNGNRYIINGSKIFITHGISSNHIVLMAKGEEGINAFLLDANEFGIERNKLNDKMGVRGSDTAEIIFHDVEVNRDRIIGKPGEGFRQVMDVLIGGRIAISGVALGIAKSALQKSIEYSKERTAFNQKLADFEGIQFYLAEMATEIRAAELLAEKAAEMYDNGMHSRLYSSMAKYKSSQVAMLCSRLAIQIHGGYGYFRDFGIDRLLRDAKLMEIGEGTNEIQKIIISKELLK